MWFLSWLMCGSWSLVFVLSDCLFNSARVRTFCKLNENSGSDCLVFSAHVVELTRFFSGKWMGKSVCFASRGNTESLFCSSH